MTIRQVSQFLFYRWEMEALLFEHSLPAGPGFLGIKPRTMLRFPAAWHASPAAAPSGPRGSLQRRSLTKHSCVQLPKEQGPISLSKLFISPSKSRKNVFPGEKQRLLCYKVSRLHSEAMLSPCPAPHACAFSPSVLPPGLAPCQAVSRTRQACTPRPFLLGLCPGY